MKKIVILLALMLIVSLSFAEPVVTQNADGVTYDVSYQVPDGACFSKCAGKKWISDISLEQIPLEENSKPRIEIFGTKDARKGTIDIATGIMTFIQVPASLANHDWNIVYRIKDYEYWIHANELKYKEKGNNKTRWGFRMQDPQHQ